MPARMTAPPNNNAPYCWTLPLWIRRSSWPVPSAPNPEPFDCAVDDLLVDGAVEEVGRFTRADADAR